MTYVSKKPLKKDVKKRLDEQFIKTIVALRTTPGGKNFISELLTESEQIMLAKRLMMIFMLAEGISQYRIKQLLHVSSSTVAHIGLGFKSGKFEHIRSVCRHKKSHKTFLDELEVIVRLGMPSMGKDRWKWLDELYR